jgi:hypothetical protein
VPAAFPCEGSGIVYDGNSGSPIQNSGIHACPHIYVPADVHPFNDSRSAVTKITRTSGLDLLNYVCVRPNISRDYA